MSQNNEPARELAMMEMHKKKPDKFVRFNELDEKREKTGGALNGAEQDEYEQLKDELLPLYRNLISRWEKKIQNLPANVASQKVKKAVQYNNQLFKRMDIDDDENLV